MLKKLLFQFLYVFAVFSADICDLWQENHHVEVSIQQEVMLEADIEPEIELINYSHTKQEFFPQLSFIVYLFILKTSPAVQDIFKPPRLS